MIASHRTRLRVTFGPPLLRATNRRADADPKPAHRRSRRCPCFSAAARRSLKCPAHRPPMICCVSIFVDRLRLQNFVVIESTRSEIALERTEEEAALLANLLHDVVENDLALEPPVANDDPSELVSSGRREGCHDFRQTPRALTFPVACRRSRVEPLAVADCYGRTL